MAKKTLSSLLVGRPDLNWFSPNVAKLPDDKAFLAILNYGQWSDVQQAIKLIGLDRAKILFTKLNLGKRPQLRPEIKHYFSLYFKKYAS